MHELPSQLEHQIDQKMKRRLRRMKIQDADNNNIDTAAAAVGRRKKSAQKNINTQLAQKIGAKGGNNDADSSANNDNIGRRGSNDEKQSHQVGEEQYYNTKYRRVVDSQLLQIRIYQGFSFFGQRRRWCEGVKGKFWQRQ